MTEPRRVIIPQLGPASPVRYAPAAFDEKLAVWFWTHAIPARAVKVREDLRASTNLQGYGAVPFQFPR